MEAAEQPRNVSWKHLMWPHLQPLVIDLCTNSTRIGLHHTIEWDLMVAEAVARVTGYSQL